MIGMEVLISKNTYICQETIRFYQLNSI